MSKLLIDEPPLQVLPTLAQRIGLNAAIVLQQLHFLTLRSPHIRHGADRVLRRWEFRTLRQWNATFPWWSQRTIERTFEALEGKGLILVEHFGQSRGDMTNWYAVHHEAVSRLADHFDKMADSSFRQNDEMPSRQLDVFNITTDCRDAHFDKMTKSSLQEVVVVKEKDINNNTPAREAPANPNGVVVVDSDSDKDIPTPRVEAYRVLQTYGVSEGDILPIIRLRSDSEIQRLVSYLDFLRSKGKQINNPGGWLFQMARKDSVQIPPGAEAAYRRRFLDDDVGDVAGDDPPASVPQATPMEPDAFDLRLGALGAEERTNLRNRASIIAHEQNPEMSERLLECETINHMRRLLPPPTSPTAS